MGFLLLILWNMAEIIQIEQETQLLGYKLYEVGPHSLCFGLLSLFKPLSCPYELLCSSQSKGSPALVGGLET